MKKLIQILGCLGAAAILAPAVSITSLNTGTFTTDGFGNGITPSPGFLTTGSFANGYRGFIVFDLTGQSGTVSGVSLTIQNIAGTFTPASWSGTLSIWDVSTAITAGNDLGSFPSPGSGSGMSVFNDLGTGTLLGSAAYSTSSGAITVNLSDASIQSLLGGKVAFGLTMSGGPGNSYAFNSAPSGADRPVLSFTLGTGGGGGGQEPPPPPPPTVPEPGTWALMGTALVGLGFARRRG